MTQMSSQSSRDRRPGPDGRPFDLASCVSDLTNSVAKGMSHHLENSDVTPIDFALMLNCAQRGECTATDLAAHLPVDPSRISRIVARLVDKGWLQRRRRRNDRRMVMLQLTDQGELVMADLRERVGAFDAELTKGVSDEDMNVFISVAFKIIANGTALGR